MSPLTAAESWKLWDSAGRYRGPSGGELLKPYPGARLTRYERFYLRRVAQLQWQLIVITDRFTVEVSEYESRTEAELALPALARKRGCRAS